MKAQVFTLYCMLHKDTRHHIKLVKPKKNFTAELKLQTRIFFTRDLFCTYFAIRDICTYSGPSILKPAWDYATVAYKAGVKGWYHN